MSLKDQSASFVLQDSRFQAVFTLRRNVVMAEAMDLTCGVRWGVSPVARLQVYDRACQRIVRCDGTHQTLRRTEAGVELLLQHEGHGLCVVVQCQLDNGELLVRVPTNRIVESRPQLSLLAGIDLLPDLLTVSPIDRGHLILPVQAGSLCYPDRHQRLQDAFLIYGQQHRWEDLPLLPFTAAVRSASDAALLAIAAPGDCDAECHVRLDGRGGGVTGFATRLRYTPIDPVDPVDRVVRFVALRGKDAGYAGVGRRLHRFIGEHLRRPLLSKRAADNPALEYASSSYVVKIFHAHKAIGDVNGDGQYQVWTTFKQAAQQLSMLHRQGIERVWVQCVGWNTEGHDGMWPTRFPIDRALGGEEGLRQLIHHGQSLGYMMQLHDNYIDHYKRSPDFDPDYCIGSLYGEPLRQAVWSGGLNHRGWGPALPDSRLREQMQQLKALGIDGIGYLDAMGMPLELSYNARHGQQRYRRACADGIVRLLRTAQEVYGSCGTEMGYLYCALHADDIASDIWPPRYRPTQPELCDRLVPIWHMALKGYLGYCSGHLHHAVIDGQQANASLARRMLQLVEIGAKPRLETTYVVPSWDAYPLDAMLDAITLEYDLMCRRLQSIALAPLEDHALLDGDPAIGNHVTHSRFGDGTTILCDYDRHQLHIDGQPYSLPISYAKKQRLPIGSRPAHAKQHVEAFVDAS